MFRAPKIILLIAPTRAFDRGLLQGIARYANEYGPWTFYREPPHYQAIDWKKKVSDRLRDGIAQPRSGSIPVERRNDKDCGADQDRDHADDGEQQFAAGLHSRFLLR